MTRRSLIRRALVFSIAVAIYPLMPGCQRFQDVVAEVDKWVGAGLSTFASIVKILQSLGVVIPGGTLVNTLVGLVPQIISDALQGITNAIAAYNNAPADSEGEPRGADRNGHPSGYRRDSNLLVSVEFARRQHGAVNRGNYQRGSLDLGLFRHNDARDRRI